MYNKPGLPNTGYTGVPACGALVLADHVLTALVLLFALLALRTIVGEFRARNDIEADQ